jgi:DNA-binding MarR family transcriptional regulator
MALEPDDWELWDSWMQAQRLLTRELDRDLQRSHGISKAEFSVLVTLHRAADGQLRVSELAESLDWDKGRVAHQLTRMESRDLIDREAGRSSTGRRVAVRLTPAGRDTVERALRTHAKNIRRLFFDVLTTEQAAAIRAWSNHISTTLSQP